MKAGIIASGMQSKTIDEYSEQALGPPYIAGAVHAAGHDVTLFHEYPETDELDGYDVIGFSVNTQDVPMVIKTAEELKRADSGTVIVAGGPHVSGEVHEYYHWRGIGQDFLPLIKSPDIDYLIAREGEEAFPELLENIAKEKVSERIILAGRIKDLDELPYPTEYRNPGTFNQLYGEEERILIPVIESRGCLGRGGRTCKFCSSGASWGREIIYRSGENVLGEIEDVIRTYGLELGKVSIFFDGLELMMNQRAFYGLLEVFEGRSYRLGSCGDVRLATKETLFRMRKAGYGDVLWGIESLDQRILNLYKPGLSLEDIMDTMKRSSDEGIRNTGLLMMGFPEETRESLSRWVEHVPGLVDDIRFSIATPFPGTALRKDIIQRGYPLEPYSERYDSGHMVYNHPRFMKGELEEIHSEIISELRGTI